MNYAEIRETQPPKGDYFFAFSDNQFAEGRAKIDGKILSGGYGLYGTKAGITELLKWYDDRDKKIAETINPQKVYDFEYLNHECSYTNDDSEVIALVVRIYGEDVLEKIKRRWR